MSDKDMQLFHKIADELKSAGHSVEILDERDDFSTEYDAIFHMSRTATTLEKLAKCETKGLYVTNPVNGVKNCSRKKCLELFDKNNIKQPPYMHTTSGENISIRLPGWLKKSEGWSCNADDVQFITSTEEYKKAIVTLAAKGCNETILCEHITGDIVKFYGIQGEDFFRWHYPDPATTKFGLEKINGAPQRHKFDTTQLRDTAFRAAKALNIKIFGGDCIITAKGEIYIIDLNDFPSFSAYRDEAAKKIATSITKRK